jgi:hypothetical protein
MGWALISTPLINMMKIAGFGLYILTALTLVSVTFICYVFVNDTNVVHIGHGVCYRQRNPGADARGCEPLGGWLEGNGRHTRVPSKSYWYLDDFIWDGKKWVYATKEDIPRDISIQTVKEDRRVNLTRYNVDHAEETLGIYIVIDRNNAKECVALCEKADKLQTAFLGQASSHKILCGLEVSCICGTTRN